MSTNNLNPVSMIQIKRSNHRPHTNEELSWWIQEYARGNIPDYQMSAWLMAVCWRGLTKEETAILTRCMVESGQQLTWPMNDDNDKYTYIDKHSTGGVGDKISLVLTPLLLCVAQEFDVKLRVPMIAGRGLGHTGGTIDKLESIPGFQTTFSIETFQKLVCSAAGGAIGGQSNDMCLADKKLYALRDVTSTVSCVPLQTSSIMCKKIAERLDSLILDVKYGKAAFQSTAEEAQELALSMITTGEQNAVTPTTAFLTRMDHPIGYAVGNLLEVIECISLMMEERSEKYSDLEQLIILQASQLLLQSGTLPQEYSSLEDTIVPMVSKLLRSGKVYGVFRDMTRAQGGNLDVIDKIYNSDATTVNKTTLTECIRHTMTIAQCTNEELQTLDILATNEHCGAIVNIDALLVGNTSVRLGAGRFNKDDPIDPYAGIWLYVKVGDCVVAGQVIATLFVSQKSQDILQECADILLHEAIQFGNDATPPPPIISHLVTSQDGVQEFPIPKCLLLEGE